MEKLEFESDMIRLKDLLKATDIIPSGGLAKNIIKDEGVILNGQPCFVPGKKLYKGDVLVFDNIEITIV
ncbi:MAG: RNA-binding S4 domain-containing protein [Anaerococcus sp.]|nr:RNA-binding S4 domain-containing protein [Anaerococcus sp.]MDD7045096.1 RNA-binding S4 domain-containing protein [Peptoniphilaceae bacterium]MDY2919305.1 RNA-binding S4 domain-containing protein [Anaerococcus sp.]